MTDQAKVSELLALTANIVSAHVSNNSVAGDSLPKLIRDVYVALSTLGAPADAKSERPTPAVAIKKSVTPDFIICLEDTRGLSDGCPELRQAALQACTTDRIGHAGTP
jgi:predicted transcriptional regulator